MIGGDKFKWVRAKPYFSLQAIQDGERAARLRDFRAGVVLLPWHWSKYVEREFERRGGVDQPVAVAWFEQVAALAGGRLPLSASDDDLRAAAKGAARDGLGVCELANVRKMGAVRSLLASHCGRWGIDAPGDKVSDGPAIARMLCARWWLRKLRRAHGRRAGGAAIVGGVVRRGLWPYASQDSVERRTAQRRRNARALKLAIVECAESGERLNLAEVVAGSIANPEVKRAELMVRVKGCDAWAYENDFGCEFWTLTCPSRMHSQRITGAVSDANPVYDGTTPRDAQRYLTRVWARARAAWKRRGLAVFGLRTAEPHHDATPHWHIIVYGDAVELRYARRLLRVYALRDSASEPGAKKHRFNYQKAKAGTQGAAYAAKYVAKNINGEGVAGDIDHECGKRISTTVERVDAWAAEWGIRQFQFFGCPSISVWRVLRRLRVPVAVVGSKLEQARQCADDSDFAGFWKACQSGGLKLIYRAADALTTYGDAAAARIAGVSEGARRAFLPVKKWVIKWAGKDAKGAAARPSALDVWAAKDKSAGVFLPLVLDFDVGLAFDLPRSCVNNCTGEGWGGVFGENPAAAVFAAG